MADHFYWIWIIFLLFPLARIIQRYMRKRQIQNSPESSEKHIEMQFKTNQSETINAPQRNLAKPETKNMLVLGELNRGIKNFQKMQKNTGFKREELISILDDLEKRGLMRTEQKSGLFGPTVLLYATDEGFKEYYS